ncbi:hypothetical protein PybrP1_006971 [[Pythium] brassicae (nom. inval.)]|nr:hypothetical protein PybrP1_006971 [[Pythium] brassicae (nom. inval.)]
MKIEARQRFSSDADLEGDDAALQMPRRPAGLRPAPSARKPPSSRGGGSLRALPVLFALLALASIGGLVHYWGFTASMYPEHAPRSVEIFGALVKKGFYADGAGFYRNEPNFVLQGGGYLAGKKSPFANLPVEYSLPSQERMVVIARGRKADSGSSEFAIMLHDNTESNKPTEDGPGYTVFGRVVAGWHTIQQATKAMRVGMLPRDELNRQIDFKSVEVVLRVTHESHEVRMRLEELSYVLETAFTAVIFSEHNSPETKELKSIFAKHKAAVRVASIGYSAGHPYEREALRALTGQDSLPLVYINQKLVGGYDQVQQLSRDGRLQALLERSGVLAEPTVWNAITRYPVVVFSKSYCPYCKKAKETLSALGAKPYVFELDLRDDGPAIQAFLLQFTHQATVPNVFIKGKSIGGSDDTLALYKSGELKEKLESAGAI